MHFAQTHSVIYLPSSSEDKDLNIPQSREYLPAEIESSALILLHFLSFDQSTKNRFIYGSSLSWQPSPAPPTHCQSSCPLMHPEERRLWRQSLLKANIPLSLSNQVNERNDIPSGWILKWLSCFKDATMTKLMVKDQQHYETLRCMAIPFFTPSGWP